MTPATPGTETKSDTKSSELVTLTIAAKVAPGRPSANAVWRWCRKGVRSRGGEYIRLLLHPNTLDAWCRLVQRGSKRRDFATQTQLLAELIKELRLEASRSHGVHDAELQAVVDRTRQYMESTGRLMMPMTNVDDVPRAIHACCAVGLLVSIGGSVGFPHQSYFDHLVARAAVRESGRSEAGILRWVKGDQSLARRDQLRQLLFLLRDEDPLLASRATEAIMNDAEVRFHLKHLVLGVLREAEPIDAHDVEMIKRLVQRAEWRDHLRSRVLWESTDWFDALQKDGFWARCLAASTADERIAWLNVVCSVMKHRPTAVDQLLQPTLTEPDGLDAIARVLPWDPADDSPAIGVLREHQITRGLWAIPDVLLDRIGKHNPRRAVRMVAAMVRGILRRVQRVGTADAGSEDRGVAPQHAPEHN